MRKICTMIRAIPMAAHAAARAISGTRARWLLLAAVLLAPPLRGEQLTVATAANFRAPLIVLAQRFEAETDHELTPVIASTGQLYAQIVNGAPFDVLLAADRERPQRLVDEGYAVAGSGFSYAIGQLALWTREPALMNELTLDSLGRDNYRWLAIANPDLAPYGLAARQTLESLGLWQRLQARLVTGQNIAQTFVMAETRNAQLGLVALAQLADYDGSGVYIVVPAHLHEPIRQDAVLLERGRHNRAALAFVDFLRSRAAADIVERFGYTRVRP
jgi:molybdate transport system substrate-binding protein